MAKVHLQANAGNTMAPFAFCASQIKADGKVKFNGRRSYAFMRSSIVRGNDFVAASAADRCAHCCDVLRQRADRSEGHTALYARVCEAK